MCNGTSALVITNYLRANSSAPVANTIQVQGSLTASGLVTLGNSLEVNNIDGLNGYVKINGGNALLIANFLRPVGGYNNGTVNVQGSFSTNQNLTVYGTGGIKSSSYSTTSDRRIKKHVKLLSDKPEFTIDDLKPVYYENIKTEKNDMGFIAHELAEQYPFLVTGEKDGEELQSVNYLGLIALLVKECQDLKKEVQDLKKEVKELKDL